MLKTSRLLDMPVFIKNDGNNKVVEFDVGNSNNILKFNNNKIDGGGNNSLNGLLSQKIV